MKLLHCLATTSLVGLFTMVSAQARQCAQDILSGRDSYNQFQNPPPSCNPGNYQNVSTYAAGQGFTVKWVSTTSPVDLAIVQENVTNSVYILAQNTTATSYKWDGTHPGYLANSPVFFFELFSPGGYGSGQSALFASDYFNITSTASSSSSSSTPTATSASGAGSTATGTASTTSSASSSTSTEAAKSTSNAAAIGGGVGGGVAALLIIAAIAFFCLRRKKQSKNREEAMPMYDQNMYNQPGYGAQGAHEMHTPYEKSSTGMYTAHEKPGTSPSNRFSSPSELADSSVPSRYS